MKTRIFTPKEHREITVFLSDVLYSRPLTITPGLKRMLKHVKENIDTYRNHAGLVEQLMDNAELIQSSYPSTQGEENG